MILSAGCDGCDQDLADDETHLEQSGTDETVDDGHPALIEDRFAEVDCPGIDEGQDVEDDASRLVYGTVFGPQQDLDDNTPEGEDDTDAGDLPSVLDAPSPVGGSPVPATSVILVEVDDGAQTRGSILEQTVSDRRGRWCMGVPEDAGLGPELMAVASIDDHRLRRPLVEFGINDIDVYHEALVRVLVDEGHRFGELSDAEYLQLDERARLSIEDVQARPGAGIDSVISRLIDTLESDEQFSQLSRTIFEDSPPDR